MWTGVSDTEKLKLKSLKGKYLSEISSIRSLLNDVKSSSQLDSVPDNSGAAK